MGHIIVVRNPNSDKLIAIVEDCDEGGRIISEFRTAEEAEAAAREITVCQAWPYQVHEVLI